MNTEPERPSQESVTGHQIQRAWVINRSHCIAPTGDLWSSVLREGGYNREEEDEIVRLIT